LKSQLPKFYETFIPILEVLKGGEAMPYSELRNTVKVKYFSGLPDELYRLTTKGGDPLILNRIGWGKAYLKQAKLVSQPGRALVQITPKGLDALRKGEITLKGLRQDVDFVQHANNRVEVVEVSNSSPQDLIDQGLTDFENQVKMDLLDKLKSVDPYGFERIVLKLLNKMGYGEYVETKKSGDQGIDGVIHQDKLGLDKIYIQAKRYNENLVREPEIRNFIGAMSGDTTRGVFVTTSDFHEAAVKKASDAHHKLVLINGSRLVQLMFEYGVGVQTSSIIELKELDLDFFDKI
jgi:restriction system protein